jgi:hypothetical protein
MGHPDATNRSWRSGPVIPGIWTSAIKQAVVRRRSEFKKSSARSNETATYPCDLKRAVTASLMDPSSSTTAITIFLGHGFSCVSTGG